MVRVEALRLQDKRQQNWNERHVAHSKNNNNTAYD